MPGKRFDLAIDDQDSFAGAGAGRRLEVIRYAACCPWNDRGTSRVSRPTGQRVHFVVQKPFTSDLFSKTLKAAYHAIASRSALVPATKYASIQLPAALFIAENGGR